MENASGCIDVYSYSIPHNIMFRSVVLNMFQVNLFLCFQIHILYSISYAFHYVFVGFCGLRLVK